MVSLLMTCKQISDEYHESVFAKLHATIHWANVPSTPSAAQNRTFQAASHQVRHISLIREDATKHEGKFVRISQALLK